MPVATALVAWGDPGREASGDCMPAEPMRDSGLDASEEWLRWLLALPGSEGMEEARDCAEGERISTAEPERTEPEGELLGLAAEGERGWGMEEPREDWDVVWGLELLWLAWLPALASLIAL